MFIAKANLGLLADSHSSPQSLADRKEKICPTMDSTIAKQAPEFDPRSYGYRKLGELISASKLFEIDEKTVGNGPSIAIYLKDIRKK